MRKFTVALFVSIGVFAIPTLVLAQAQITGVVRDTSGAVLPGVTVEAASPALIEKVRTVQTDGSGQYRIVDLRPGTYSVTFTLAGFSTFQRPGIELTGSFTATVNAEMRVGTLEETVTVASEAPTVDVQSARQQRVFNKELLEAVPTGRTPIYAAILVPGVSVNVADVGGTNNLPLTGGQLSIHGSDGGEQRLYVGGMSTHDAEGGGAWGAYVVNMSTAQEVTVDYAAGTAEQSSGGVQTNVIPKEGGNSWSGAFFATGVNSGLQGSNYSDDLIARGLKTPNTIRRAYDVNPGFGGPIRKDKVWFYLAARFASTSNYVGSLFENKNAGDPTKFLYEPDTARRAFNQTTSEGVNARVTWQLNSTNKLAFFHDQQWRCTCSDTQPTSTSEASSRLLYPVQTMSSVSWTSTPTNRLLIDVGTGLRRERYVYGPPPGQPILAGVTELGGLIPGLRYRGSVTARDIGYSTLGVNSHTKASVAYVTGSHEMKAGLTQSWVERYVTHPDNQPLTYTIRNGVPVSLQERATPWEEPVFQPWDLGIYAQDKWTINRLTLSGGVRFDYIRIYSKAQTLGPGSLVPNRNYSIPETELVNFKDISPRLAGTYNLFGSGKTAVKLSVNKYMGVLGPQLGYMNGAVAPIHALANVVTRSWNDANSNFVPNCDLTSPFANGECGTVSDTNFGRSNLVYSQTNDPRAVSGWGNRPYQWEFAGGVQQELMPRVSVEAGYFRRWKGNFSVLDNTALASADFSPFSVTAPADPRLPGGGGYVIGPFYDLNPDAVTRPNVNVLKPASDYGNMTERWHGVDLTLNARPRGGVTVQGGLSTGHRTDDNCDILEGVPEATSLPTTVNFAFTPLGVPYCHSEGAWATQVKFVAAYTIPRIDVQLSGALQSQTAPTILANYAVSNAVVRTSLGRDLSASKSVVTIGLIQPGSINGDRMNQLDLRFGKLLRVGRTRMLASFDVYNALNNNAVLTENAFYQNASLSGWRTPTSTLTARFVKFTGQFSF